METYTITKSQLLEYFKESTAKQEIQEKTKLPTVDLNVRVAKSGVLNFVATGEDKGGWLEIVPANRNTKKVVKLTQDQFAVLLFNLMAKKTEENNKSL